MKTTSLSVVPIPLMSTIRRIIAQILGFLLLLIPSFITRYLTDSMIEQNQEIPFYWIALVILASMLIHLFCFYYVNYRSQVFDNSLASEFGSIIGRKIATCSMPAYEKESKSKILNIMQMDMSSIYTLSSYVVCVPANIIKILLVLALLFNAHYGLALIALLLAPLYLLSSYTNKNKLEKLVNEERKTADAWVQEMEVIINGKVSIGLNHAFPYLLNRFNQKKQAFYDARNRQHFYLLITKELPGLITTMAPLLILIIGGNLAVYGQLTLGTLLFAIQLVGLIFEPMAEIASLHAEMMSLKPIFQRGKDFVALPDEEAEPEAERPGQASPEPSAIYLKQAVLLRPDSSPLFSIESFRAQNTGLILIKGENGCGKSSLFNLFAGVFSENQLKLLEDGCYQFSAASRSRLGYLFYPNFLFPGTIRENILYDRQVSSFEYERIHALLNLPPSDKQVSIRPENLSLGEKQKVYLARLLLGEYSCLLLDEPGSNLDDQTEANLIAELAERKKQCLVIVISHNTYYNDIADQIYQIKDHKMVAL